ncbi:MAG TPA: PIN domain-containing protein [Gemmatimonadales bacterium]|nr:PIN domain-containing protein [Gemmatimonadales bacterium]
MTDSPDRPLRRNRPRSSPALHYVADTNVYVAAANDAAFRERLEGFIRANGPLLVSAVVVAEVLLGIADATQHAAAVRALAAGTTLAAPETADWTRAAAAVVRLGGEAVTKSRSFWNDALLAAQCARVGATLVTHNVPDFRRLGPVLGIRAAAPFP